MHPDPRRSRIDTIDPICMYHDSFNIHACMHRSLTVNVKIAYNILQPTCMQKRRRSPKHTSAMYLALLLLCAGDIETNPGPIMCKLIIHKN